MKKRVAKLAKTVLFDLIYCGQGQNLYRLSLGFMWGFSSKRSPTFAEKCQRWWQDTCRYHGFLSPVQSSPPIPQKATRHFPPSRCLLPSIFLGPKPFDSCWFDQTSCWKECRILDRFPLSSPQKSNIRSPGFFCNSSGTSSCSSAYCLHH